MPRTVTVISKSGCHLCEKVLTALDSLSSRYDIELKVVDISDDPALNDRYWLDVPVVQIDGRDVFDARAMGSGEDYARKLELLLR